MLQNLSKKIRSVLFFRIFVDPVRWPPGRLLFCSVISFLSTILIISLVSSLKVTSELAAKFIIPLLILLIYLSIRLAYKSNRAAASMLNSDLNTQSKMLRFKYRCYELVGGLLSAFFSFMFFVSFLGLSRGRQITRRGKVILPRVEASEDWTKLSLTPREMRTSRCDIANQWRENGRTEYASVSAFAALAQELIALGCPPKLVYAANRDSLDEILHAELCFSLAKDIDGYDMGPRDFPKSIQKPSLINFRIYSLIRLATSSLVHGVLLEAVSGRVAARLTRICEDPSTQKVLKTIASDEMRHAAHAWDVVEWCVEEGGYLIYCCIHAVHSRLPDVSKIHLPTSAIDGSWEIYGIHGAEMQQQEYTRAKADLGRKLAALKVKQFGSTENVGIPQSA